MSRRVDRSSSVEARLGALFSTGASREDARHATMTMRTSTLLEPGTSEGRAPTPSRCRPQIERMFSGPTICVHLRDLRFLRMECADREHSVILSDR